MVVVWTALPDLSMIVRVVTSSPSPSLKVLVLTLSPKRSVHTVVLSFPGATTLGDNTVPGYGPAAAHALRPRDISSVPRYTGAEIKKINDGPA